MIRKIIRPEYTHLTVDIPTEYIDREIELILFPVDTGKPSENTADTQTKKSLRGIFGRYANKNKKALEESAWEKHVIDKFMHD